MCNYFDRKIGKTLKTRKSHNVKFIFEYDVVGCQIVRNSIHNLTNRISFLIVQIIK